MPYSVGSVEVIQRKITGCNVPQANLPPGSQDPNSIVLETGFKRKENCAEIVIPTIWESDLKVPLRDGTILLADVFRPVGKTDVPVLLAWSPYGKSGTGHFSLDLTKGRVGIPKDRLSGFESFESFDPATWVRYGYSVVNVNARGILGSEGDHRWHGTSEGRDGYDTIEFIASLPWTNGRVCLIGNSWLATAQWFIAAQRPPHLACILALEGLSDVYRETLCRGGVPCKPFWSFLMQNGLYGNNYQEDVISMIERYPLMNEYWEDKRAASHMIQVPAYILASMSTGLHTVGSLRSFEDIPHEQKWLRMHSTQEWHDLYQEHSIADFKRFLDFYMKDIQNNWKETARVRISVLRFNSPPLNNLPFSDWPILETQYQPLYLSDDGVLKESQEAIMPGTTTYQGDVIAQQMDDDPEEAIFRYTFKRKTRIIGASKAFLYMSCPDSSDFDVFLQLRKADKIGKILCNVNIPLEDLGVQSEEEVQTVNTLKYLGPTGILRASHRSLDAKLSKPHWLAHDHSKRDLIPPGQIVKLETSIWPAAIEFDQGEQLILKIAGHHMTLAEFEPLRGGFIAANKGRHIVHFGEGYESRIDIPIV